LSTELAHAGDAIAFASAACFAAANVTIARGVRGESEDNGAFVSLLITIGISGALWLAFGIARGFEPVTIRALLWFAGAGVFTAFIGRVFYYASVQRLGAMRSAAMKRLNPFFALILGVAVLGETLTGNMVVGLALIAASFAVLVAASARGRVGERAGVGRRLLDAGYIYGPISALGYATGYLLRKMGLADAPDALLGAMVGCIVGAALFVATAAFNRDYAAAVRATFRRPNPWLLGAGVLSSFGQILYFAALNVSPMSRVALIGSMEVFVTLLLTAVFLKEKLTASIGIAATLGVLGTAFIVASG
jgi:drug/metabolite transporter (DMT)-like permease